MRRAHGRGPSNFTTGLIALVVIVCGTYMGFAKRLPWASDYELRAVFSSANELHPNSPVRIAGVEVGRVRKVERGPGNAATVTMAIKDNGRPVHRDATMKIRPRIFLEGNFFIDLKPGTGAAPELGDGDRIPLGQTATPVQLDEILSGLNRSTRDQLKVVLREYATALDGGGARALHDSFPSWEGAFKGVAIVSQSLRGTRTHDLSDFISASGRTAAALASHDRQLADLVTNFNHTVRALGGRQAEVAATIENLAGTLRVAPGALSAINAALPPLRAFTAEVRPALRALPRTLDLAQPLLRQVDGLLAPAELTGLIGDLRPAVRQLTALEPRLNTLLALVRPVTECVRRNATPVLKSTLDDGKLSSAQPVWQELLHGVVGLASASQNFDGNGPAVRYYASFGDQLVSTGSVPGFGKLVGLSPEPPIGSRPPKAATQPPFRPGAPCSTQTLPDLKTGVRAAPPSRTVRPVLPKLGSLDDLLAAAVKAARR